MIKRSFPVGFGHYIDMREGHIARTQKLSGLRAAWIDFLSYLGEAIIKERGDAR